MGIALGIGCIVASIWNIRTKTDNALFYAIGLPVGGCCILAQMVL